MLENQNIVKCKDDYFTSYVTKKLIFLLYLQLFVKMGCKRLTIERSSSGGIRVNNVKLKCSQIIIINCGKHIHTGICV